MITAKVIADSINPTGQRLTSLECTYPRFIHSEILTHRDRARNSASSRAIPWPAMMTRIMGDPVIPARFGLEQKGMQTSRYIEPGTSGYEILKSHWLEARDFAVKKAQELADLGVHKSLCNRLTEPFIWITVVMSATEWENFFTQRLHEDAEIHMQMIAQSMYQALRVSEPEPLKLGEWHLPYVDRDEKVHLLRDGKDPRHISVARCARVSYLTHGDTSRSWDKDFALFERLKNGSGGIGHRSPAEHVAQSDEAHYRSGPFKGWLQYRKMVFSELATG